MEKRYAETADNQGEQRLLAASLAAYQDSFGRPTRRADSVVLKSALGVADALGLTPGRLAGRLEAWAFLQDSVYSAALGLQNRLWYVPKTFSDGYECRFMADMALILSWLTWVVLLGVALLASALLEEFGTPLSVTLPPAAGVLLALGPLLTYLGILAYGLRRGPGPWSGCTSS